MFYSILGRFGSYVYDDKLLLLLANRILLTNVHKVTQRTCYDLRGFWFVSISVPDLEKTLNWLSWLAV